jgi:hypothetical protein
MGIKVLLRVRDKQCRVPALGQVSAEWTAKEVVCKRVGGEVARGAVVSLRVVAARMLSIPRLRMAALVMVEAKGKSAEELRMIATVAGEVVAGEVEVVEADPVVGRVLLMHQDEFVLGDTHFDRSK